MTVSVDRAGRELDALVAERVMGWTRCVDPTHGSDCAYWWDKDQDGHGQEAFSTEIEAAWQVVERMKQNGMNVWVGWAGTVWVCGCTAIVQEVEAETAPLAICLAAVQAVQA